MTPDGNDATPGEPSPEPGQATPEPGGLMVRTVPIDDPGDLLARVPPAPALAWVRQGCGLVGWGEVARITLPAGEDRFTAGEKWLRDLFEGAVAEDRVQLPGTGPVAFGSFTFDPASDGSVLIVPRVILGRDQSGQAWFTTISHSPEPAARPGTTANPDATARPGTTANPDATARPGTTAGPAPRGGWAGTTAA